MEEEGKEDGWTVEDDCDALNDETFGDEGEEYNWDQANQKIFDTEERKANGGGKHPAQAPHSRNLADYPGLEGPTRGSNYEEDFDNENALEESISRLVMDDFDDDEEEVMKSKLRRLGASANFSTYFMPPQVASKHLQWFMDKEFPGGSSLLGSSVWSMHPTSAPPADVSIGNTPSSAKVSSDSKNGSGVASSAVGRVHNLNQDSRVLNLSNLIGASPSQSSSRGNRKPVFKTVEELEREFLEDEDTPTSKMNDLNSGGLSASSRPKIMTAEELERELMRNSSPPKRILEPQNIQTPPPGHKPSAHQDASSIHLTPKAQQAVHTPTNTPQFQQHPYSPGGRLPPGLHTPPGMNMSPMMMQHPQRMMHPNMSPNLAHSPSAFNHRVMSNAGMMHQIPPNIAAQLAYQQQQQIRMLQMNPHLRGRLPFMMPFHPHMVHPMRPGFPMPPGPHGMGPMPLGSDFRRPINDDPYRGLMNEKDKQRLRNIQIIQLQNDHPYTTDYYCLMYKVRHGNNDPKRREYLSKLFPRKSNENSNRNEYQPAHFENSLGKLQAVSALAPKKAIDTVIRVVDSGPCNRSGVKAYRYLLLEVERLYDSLLKIQEADIRKTLLMNADDTVTSFRAENTTKVIRVLESTDKLMEILCVKKGKMLISRLIPLMEPAVRYSTFAFMIRTFPSWAVINGSEIEKTFPFLRHCIFAGELQHIMCLVGLDIDSKIYDFMVKSQLGLSLILAIMHRVENIITESMPPLSEEVIESWLTNARQMVLSILLHDGNLANPIEVSQLVLPHVKRFGLNSPELQVFENRVKNWISSGVPQIPV